MNETLTLSDIVPETEPIIIPQSRQYNLESVPEVCPRCGCRNIRYDNDRIWYCGMCGAYQMPPVQEFEKPTEEALRPEKPPKMIDFICENCGTPDKKGIRAVRVLCKKCETARINANRRKGVILSTAYKVHVCDKCYRAIHINTKYYTNKRRSWHMQCYAGMPKKKKERPQLGA